MVSMLLWVWKRKTVFIMRLTFSICLFCVLQSFAIGTFSQNQRLSISQKNISVESVMQLIEDQTDYYFMYSALTIDVKRTINLEATNKLVPEILDDIFKNTDVSYKINGRLIALTRNGEISMVARQITVSGKVTDSTGGPLPGVTVVIKGTNNGKITDTDGNYSLSGVSDNAILIFSFVGMKTVEEPVSGRSTINIQMEEENIGLEEVVAVGYGIQKKENLTGAVASVSSEKLTQRPALRTDQMLQGLATGVTVFDYDGSPGSSPSVTIRGLGTLGNNAPLVIIDGVPGQFDMVDPTNIKSISVLKDAASAAIYGSRAAGGVILITTKRGEKEGLKVSYDGFAGIQTPYDLPKYLGAEGYLKYYNEALKNETGTDQNFQPLNPNNDTDWVKETIKNGAIQQQHVVTFSGGTEKIRSNLALTYQNQDGIIENSDFERFSVRSNNDFIVSDILKFSFDLSIKRDIDKQPGRSEYEVFSSVRRIPPIYSGINFDGDMG